jgi:hypothetical protein
MLSGHRTFGLLAADPIVTRRRSLTHFNKLPLASLARILETWTLAILGDEQRLADLPVGPASVPSPSIQPLAGSGQARRRGWRHLGRRRRLGLLSEAEAARRRKQLGRDSNCVVDFQHE